MTSKHCYITTTIPYVNGSPHLGHALEFIQADALARLHKAQGNSVTLQTGRDDNAIKNIHSAKQAGVDPKTFVDQNAIKFHQLCQALSINYDRFVRTSDPAHTKGVHEFWRHLNQEDLYRKQYSGLYCLGCEDFYKEENLVDGLCPDHKKPPEAVKEENYFFRLSRYQKDLEELIKSDRLLIEPATRKTEVLSFIKQGLTDISVSRHKSRTEGWGINVPDSSDQIIYVWIDALVNYLTGQGFGHGSQWKNVWNNETTKIHCVGKNVWKFHAIYWPALLLSAGLPLPNRIYVHGFLSEEGQRISKTLGFKHSPIDLAHRYGSDSLRFYLLQGFSSFSDGNFTEQGLIHTHNHFLANGLGNLFSRLWRLREKAGLQLQPLQKGIEEPCAPSFQFRLQIEELWRQVDRLNTEIHTCKPWEAIKKGESKSVIEDLKRWTNELRQIGLQAGPYIPEAGQRICDLLDNSAGVREIPHLFKRI